MGLTKVPLVDRKGGFITQTHGTPTPLLGTKQFSELVSKKNRNKSVDVDKAYAVVLESVLENSVCINECF